MADTAILLFSSGFPENPFTQKMSLLLAAPEVLSAALLLYGLREGGRLSLNTPLASTPPLFFAYFVLFLKDRKSSQWQCINYYYTHTPRKVLEKKTILI